MTLTEFLDTQLESDTMDVQILDQNGFELNVIDFDTAEVCDVVYHKIAVIRIKPMKTLGFSV